MFGLEIFNDNFTYSANENLFLYELKSKTLASGALYPPEGAWRFHYSFADGDSLLAMRIPKGKRVRAVGNHNSGWVNLFQLETPTLSSLEIYKFRHPVAPAGFGGAAYNADGSLAWVMSSETMNIVGYLAFGQEVPWPSHELTVSPTKEYAVVITSFIDVYDNFGPVQQSWLPEFTRSVDGALISFNGLGAPIWTSAIPSDFMGIFPIIDVTGF